MADEWDSVSTPVQASEWDAISKPAGKARQLPADWSPDQVKAYEEHTAFLQKNPAFQGGYAQRAASAASLGAAPDIIAAAQATLEAPFSSDGSTWNERRRRHFAEQTAAKHITEKNTEGLTENVTPFQLNPADLIGGLAMGPGRAAVEAVGSATALPAMAAAGQGAVVGAKFGGAGAFLGNESNIDSAEGLGNRVMSIPEGAAGGALLGGAIAGGAAAGSNALAARSSRRNALAEHRAEDVAQFNEAGVTPFGPVLTDSPTAARTAQGISNTMFGQPLRDAAGRTITDVERRAQETLRRYTEGLPSNDLGEEAQGVLRRNLTQYSQPHDTVRNMPDAELQRMTGPVSDSGFLPPRPVVEPRPPQAVQEVQPAYPNEATLPPPQVNISPAKMISEADVKLPPMEQFRLDRAEITARNANEFLKNAYAKKERLLQDLDNHTQQIETHVRSGGQQARPDDLNVMVSNRSVLGSQVEALTKRIWDAERMISDYSTAKAEAQRKVSGMVSKAQEAENAKALAMRPEAERAAREKQISDARAKAEQDAQAATETAREQARIRAEEDNRSRQSAADRQYEQEVADGNTGFRPGRTTETYPTEFSAAYETANRNTPRIQANPLLGPTQSKKAPPLESATSRVLDELGNEARGGLKLAGYKGGAPYDESGRIQPALLEHLRGLVGNDIAERLATLSERRATGQLVPDHSGMRTLRTEVRRAAEDAERPLLPGMVRDNDAVTLRRLYSALSEDMDRSLRSIGPKGERAADMHKQVDTEYARHADEMRKPLAKLFGDRTSPVQAMDKIAKAATDGDLRLLRSYMRVMEEKANPNRAAAGIVAHLTENARTMDDFVKGFGKIPPDARALMFRSEAQQAYRRDLERLERIGQLMTPYNKQHTPGIDLSSKSNLLMLATGYTHFWATLSAGAGMAATARFMASPRYVAALTKITPQSMQRFAQTGVVGNLGMLAGIANKDGEFGKSILQAAKSAFGTPAKAAFAGKASKTADGAALATAEKMLKDGASPAEVWKQTNWMKGADGRWRSEIDDSKADIKPDIDKIMSRPQDTLFLKQILDHPDLFKAYPDLANVEVYLEDDAKHRGGYIPRLNFFKLSTRPEYRKELRDTVLHEVQHYIQKQELTEYGSIKVANSGNRDGYFRQPGEDEAWQAAARKDMSADERRLAYPYDEGHRERAASTTGIPYFPQRALMRPAKDLR